MGQPCSRCQKGARAPSSSYCKDCRNIVSRKGRKRYAELNPEQRQRIATRTKSRQLVRKGKILKPATCSECEALGNVEIHHLSYDSPYSIVWLCRQCHLQQHYGETPQ